MRFASLMLVAAVCSALAVEIVVGEEVQPASEPFCGG